MKKFIALIYLCLMSFNLVYAEVIIHESFDGVNGAVGQLCAGATNTEDFFDKKRYQRTAKHPVNVWRSKCASESEKVPTFQTLNTFGIPLRQLLPFVNVC